MTERPTHWFLKALVPRGAVSNDLDRGDMVVHKDWGVGRIVGTMVWEDTYGHVADGWEVDFGEAGCIGCFERSLEWIGNPNGEAH